MGVWLHPFPGNHDYLLEVVSSGSISLLWLFRLIHLHSVLGASCIPDIWKFLVVPQVPHPPLLLISIHFPGPLDFYPVSSHNWSCPILLPIIFLPLSPPNQIPSLSLLLVIILFPFLSGFEISTLWPSSFLSLI